MVKSTNTRRIMLFTLPALVAAIGGMFALFVVVRAQGGPPTLQDWPPFTMVYELKDGQSILVGDTKVDPRQLRRLEYNSITDWVETVLEAAPAVTPYGVDSEVGSYHQVNGNIYSTFSASDNVYDEEVVEEGGYYEPGRLPPPGVSLRVLEARTSTLPTRVITEAKVCFRDICEPNAEGLLYIINGVERVFADDSRGIPLRIGDAVVVKELVIKDIKR